MDFHGINMQGYFKTNSVVDASALVWDDDEGKIVYDETSDDLWLADSSVWKNASQYVDTPLGTEMWFYEAAAPDGWFISAVAGDELIAVKGGTYAVGGQVYGNWATPAHSHLMGSHKHYFSGATGAGSIAQSHGKGSGTPNHLSTYQHTHNVTATLSQAGSPNATATNGSSSAYRPKARVGLICERI